MIYFEYSFSSNHPMLMMMIKKHAIKMIMPESFQQNPYNESHLDTSDMCLKSCPSTSVFSKMKMVKLWPGNQ